MFNLFAEVSEALKVAEKWAEQDLPKGIGVMGKKHSPIAYVAQCIEKKVSFNFRIDNEGNWHISFPKPKYKVITRWWEEHDSFESEWFDTLDEFAQDWDESLTTWDEWLSKYEDKMEISVIKESE